MSDWMEELLMLVAEHDCHDDVWWSETLCFFVKCSDAFAWACADAESITNDDMEQFKQALTDAGDDGPLLYCCRRRKMRPQGAMYKYLDRKNWSLFDACGPEREVGLGNPVAHPE